MAESPGEPQWCWGVLVWGMNDASKLGTELLLSQGLLQGRERVKRCLLGWAELV